MDENKNTNNDMNYSFDFADQVQENPVPNTQNVSPAPTEPVATPEVMPAPAEPVATPVVPESNVTNPVPLENTAQPTLASQDTPVSVEPVVASDSTNSQPVTLENTPETNNVSEETSPEDEAELIKDKKATKRFLIILTIIIVAFIIALPFLFKVAG